PQAGGDYVFIQKNIGSFAGFLFGWAQLVAILAGSIGAMAFVFGEYLYNAIPAVATLGAPLWSVAVGIIGVVAMINAVGLEASRKVQALLAVAKLVGLLGIIYVGCRNGITFEAFSLAEARKVEPGSWNLLAYATPLILVLYAFGGWNDI